MDNTILKKSSVHFRPRLFSEELLQKTLGGILLRSFLDPHLIWTPRPGGFYGIFIS